MAICAEFALVLSCDSVARKITKSIMAKLAEYLKHHREHACSEIRTPLMSENLVDSGASRWDASFVNVDKEQLWILLLLPCGVDGRRLPQHPNMLLSAFGPVPQHLYMSTSGSMLAPLAFSG